MDVYEFLMQNVGMPIAERLKKWPVRKCLQELEESQWWSRAQLEEYQNETLRKLVRHSYDTVQYYRDVFESAKITPDDIKTIADLPKIPILTKDTLKANFPYKMASNKYDEKHVRIDCSSGSTGSPVKYWTSPEEKGFRWGCIYRWRRWTGWDLGRKYCNFGVIAEVAFKDKPLLAAIEKKLSRVLILQAKEMNPGNVGDFVQKIADFDPYLLKGHPSTCYYMARYMEDNGIKFNLPACICNGETLYPFIREYVEKQFGCGIHDDYGSEGIETAAQCSPTSKFHVSAEAVIPEIVDADGSPLPAGEEGRLVVTGLAKWAMPFLRYDTQDIATLSDKACSCGRGLPLLESIKGRIVDMSLSPSGKLITVYAFTPLFAKLGLEIDGWQVVHETPDQLVVKVVPRDELRSDTSTHITSTIKSFVGDDVAVELQTVKEIELTPAGKRRFFISKCSPYQNPS